MTIPKLQFQEPGMNDSDFIETAVDEESDPTELFDGPNQRDLALVEAVDEEEQKTVELEHLDDAIKLYLRDIQKAKLLTADEEKELACRIANGDRSARDKMIESNLRLVVKIAKNYRNRGLPFLDLIAEGNLGLIKAVERFKVSKECRFSTYATWWIRQSIERNLVNQSRTIRLPVHVSDDINRMIRVNKQLVQRLNREPSVKEVAAEMGADIAQVRRLMVLVKKTYSIERPMGENNDYFLLDTIEDTSNVSAAELFENVSRYEMVSAWFETLAENEKRILTLRFGLDDEEPQTLDLIGHLYGVTRERIRQIEAKALEKIRKILEKNRGNAVTVPFA